MTDETQKLFDAPWEVCLEKRGSFYRPCVVTSDTKIASVCTKENANRLARLPELYDALMDAAKSYCQAADFDCPKKYCAWYSAGKCKALKWLDLLRKVRDGE